LACGTSWEGQLPDLDEKAMEDWVVLSPQRRTGRATALLPRNEGNHAGELPEDVSLASAREEAVERFPQAVENGGGGVLEIGGGNDVKAREAQPRVEGSEPLEKRWRKAPIPVIAVGAVQDAL
jgi:hypothetical protein